VFKKLKNIDFPGFPTGIYIIKVKTNDFNKPEGSKILNVKVALYNSETR
jgi:hypothetical protein